MRRALADGGSRHDKPPNRPSGGASRANRLSKRLNPVSTGPGCGRQATACMVVRGCLRAPRIQALCSGIRKHMPAGGPPTKRGCARRGPPMERHAIGQPPDRFPGRRRWRKPQSDRSFRAHRPNGPRHAKKPSRFRIGCDSRSTGPWIEALRLPHRHPGPRTCADLHIHRRSRGRVPAGAVTRLFARPRCGPIGRCLATVLGDRRPQVARPGGASPPRRIASTLLRCVKLRHAEDLYTQPELRQ